MKSHIVLSLCNLRPGRLSTESVQKGLLSELIDFALPLPVGFWLQRGFKQQWKCSDQQFRKLGHPVPWVKKNSGRIVDVKIGARHILSFLVVNETADVCLVVHPGQIIQILFFYEEDVNGDDAIDPPNPHNHAAYIPGDLLNEQGVVDDDGDDVIDPHSPYNHAAHIPGNLLNEQAVVDHSLQFGTVEEPAVTNLLVRS